LLAVPQAKPEKTSNRLNTAKFTPIGCASYQQKQQKQQQQQLLCCMLCLLSKACQLGRATETVLQYGYQHLIRGDNHNILVMGCMLVHHPLQGSQNLAAPL
jgi:hypothetical protein